jgi:gamma-glutamyl-gamma-aminobutyrate hydrolase PuuD
VIRRYLDGVDGLLIVGGEDVAPCLYGEAPKPGTGKMFAPRLAFEKRLYRAARRHGLPVLVEAIENDDETILAVQWHPERTLRSPASQKLFRAFVRLCARRCGGAAETP